MKISLSESERNLINSAEWEIWYQDNFDLECPRQMELSGHGLVDGLMALWARHLYGTIQSDGPIGFSRFNLWWKQRDCSIDISGAYAGQVRIRGWVYGEHKSSSKNYLLNADYVLLREIADAHCRLVLNDRTGEAVIDCALISDSQEDFAAQLGRLSAAS